MRGFWILWGGQAVSLVASHAVQFALIWWLTVQTRSAAVLAAATLVALAPPVVLGPFIGVLVDRFSRRAVMALADGGVAVASLALAGAFAAGRPSLPLVLAILLLRAIGETFHASAMVASTSLMVPARHLTRIQGLNQALQGGLNIVAAPLGAVLIGVFTMVGVMLVDVVTALAALLPLAWVRVPRPRCDPDATSGPRTVRSDLIAGWRYLRARPGHMGLVGMAAMINLTVVPAFTLLPLLVLESLGGDAARLAWMSALFGVGVILGGVLLGVWGGFRRRILTTLSGLLGLGVAIVALGLSPAAPALPGMAAMLGVGMMVPLTNGPIQAILQATVDPSLQGRVFGLMGSLCGATAPVGLLLAAPVADLVGIRSWYLVAGLVCVLMGLVGFTRPALRGIDDPVTSSASPA